MFVMTIFKLTGPGNTKGGSITVPLTSCLNVWISLLKMKTKIVSCHTADFKPVKQEVNGTMILPTLVFPGGTFLTFFGESLTTCEKSTID
jgi:hypothetical protein